MSLTYEPSSELTPNPHPQRSALYSTERASGGFYSSDHTSAGGPRELYSTDRPEGGQHASDRYTSDRYTSDRYASGAGGGLYSTDRPDGGQHASDRYAGDRYASDRYASGAGGGLYSSERVPGGDTRMSMNDIDALSFAASSSLPRGWDAQVLLLLYYSQA